MLPAVYLADQIAGDPEWFPHPVRMMGRAITSGEALLRGSDQSGENELVAGVALTAVVVTASYSLTRLIIAEVYRSSKCWAASRKSLLDGLASRRAISKTRLRSSLQQATWEIYRLRDTDFRAS